MFLSTLCLVYCRGSFFCVCRIPTNRILYTRQHLAYILNGVHSNACVYRSFNIHCTRNIAVLVGIVCFIKMHRTELLQNTQTQHVHNILTVSVVFFVRDKSKTELERGTKTFWTEIRTNRPRMCHYVSRFKTTPSGWQDAVPNDTINAFIIICDLTLGYE